MRTALFSIILALLCQSCNDSGRKPEKIAINPEAGAQQLIVAGNYLAAADEYVRLAQLHPAYATYYQLKTADSLIRARQLNQAKDILNHIATRKYNDGFYRSILLADIAVQENQGRSALNLLSVQPDTYTSAELRVLFHEIKAQAWELSFNFINASEERIKLDNYLLDPLLRRHNIKLIWEDLNRIKPEVLRDLRSSGSLKTTAWFELALINQTMLFKPGLLEQSLESWIEQYPGHLATPTITNEILALSEQAVLLPAHIALLLPLNGQYEKAAHAIRDGFLTAWYEDNGTRPLINIYDANALNIQSVYRQALRDGADFVVGPLEKQAIDSLLKLGKLEVTTLALNHSDQTKSEFLQTSRNHIPKLIQFGLSPEDEAKQAAERAFYDGHNKALILTPNNDWGLRLANSFADTWNTLGGEVLEYVSYDQRSRDYATPVKKLLNIDTSQLRTRKLRQKINQRLKGEPRLREDADMVFMAAVPVSARQIIPQFRFYRAANIPVYSSSRAYSGIDNPQADSDMNGIYLTEIPALLINEKLSSSVHNSMNRNWSVDTSSYRRLYSLGVDAYQMIPYIGKLSLQDTAVFKGETGDLYMSAEGRIQRKLLWAQFVNGRPRLLDEGRTD
jgi:uncharacterized protein